jgi:hypothetical protein
VAALAAFEVVTFTVVFAACVVALTVLVTVDGLTELFTAAFVADCTPRFTCAKLIAEIKTPAVKSIDLRIVFIAFIFVLKIIAFPAQDYLFAPVWAKLKCLVCKSFCLGGVSCLRLLIDDD